MSCIFLVRKHSGKILRVLVTWCEISVYQSFSDIILYKLFALVAKAANVLVLYVCFSMRSIEIN